MSDKPKKKRYDPPDRVTGIPPDPAEAWPDFVKSDEIGDELAKQISEHQPEKRLSVAQQIKLIKQMGDKSSIMHLVKLKLEGKGGIRSSSPKHKDRGGNWIN